MKYIIVGISADNTNQITRELPFIFPDFVTHSEYAETTMHHLAMYNDIRFARMKVVSAGFVDTLGKIRCYGESVTLKLQSRPQDSEIIRLMNYSHGIVNSIPEDTKKKIFNNIKW